MIEWHECAKHDWNYMTGYAGKRMSSWASRNIRDSVRDMFDTVDGWDALFATLNLYSELGHETADMLGYPYPEKADEKITGYVAKLRLESAQQTDALN